VFPCPPGAALTNANIMLNNNIIIFVVNSIHSVADTWLKLSLKIYWINTHKRLTSTVFLMTTQMKKRSLMRWVDVALVSSNNFYFIWLKVANTESLAFIHFYLLAQHDCSMNNDSVSLPPAVVLLPFLLKCNHQS